MKNSFMIGLVTIAIATSLAACTGNGSATTDSVKTDSSTKITVDTTRKDASSVPDSLKKDTVVKSTTTKTISKMSVNKKQ